MFMFAQPVSGEKAQNIQGGSEEKETFVHREAPMASLGIIIPGVLCWAINKRMSSEENSCALCVPPLVLKEESYSATVNFIGSILPGGENVIILIFILSALFLGGMAWFMRPREVTK